METEPRDPSSASIEAHDPSNHRLFAPRCAIYRYLLLRIRFNETRRSRVDKRKTIIVKYRGPTSRVDGNLGVLSVHRKLDENISLSCSRRSSARLVEKYNIVFYIVRSETGVTTLLTRSRSPISRTT